MRFILLFIILGCGLVAPAHANLVQSYQKQTLQQVGTTRFTWLTLNVYDATLYSSNGQYAANQPFVLELAYLRAFTGSQVANKTLTEMQRLGYNDPAQATRLKPKLIQYFSNIEAGTRLAAIYNTDGSTTFVRNGKQVLGTIADPTFSRYFFAIWLGEQTLKPALRNQLIGLKK
jgi:hypothetical protein